MDSDASCSQVPYALIHEQTAGLASGGRLARIATGSAVRRQRRVWSQRVNSWDHHAPAGLEEVTAAVLAAAANRPGDDGLDPGFATGPPRLPPALAAAPVAPATLGPATRRRPPS